MNDVAAHWEDQYAQGPRWSGKVNATLADAIEELALTPGASLDLGCGEGGDVLWLADRGWQATGLDISTTALGRAVDAAADRGLTERTTWVQGDLAQWSTEQHFDLVTASFLHSRTELPRLEILRRASEWVAPGGHLVIVSHVFRTEADIPPWARRHREENQASAHGEHEGHGDHHHGDQAGHGDHEEMPLPADEVAALDLGEDWEILTCEIRSRLATSPDGTEQATVADGLIVARRH